MNRIKNIEIAITSGVRQSIDPVAASMYTAFPSRPIIRPFISSLGKLTTDTAFSVTSHRVSMIDGYSHNFFLAFSSASSYFFFNAHG